ncbi:MAG: hypothetical protein ACRDJW_24600 [Thermomicrobiales bacterium]
MTNAHTRYTMPFMDATQIAAWPQDKQDDVSDEDPLGHLLIARVRESEGRRANLETRYNELVAEMERERQVIDRANALLSALGLVPAQHSPTPSILPDGTQRAQTEGKDFTAGNRSEKMPRRRPEFATISLTAAAKLILGSGEVKNLNDLANAIFTIQNDEHLKAAKGSLRSTMAEGVGKKLWTRETQGTFRMARGSREK